MRVAVCWTRHHPFGNKISVINIHYFMMATIINVVVLQFFSTLSLSLRVVNRVHICNFAAGIPWGLNFLIKPWFIGCQRSQAGRQASPLFADKWDRSRKEERMRKCCWGDEICNAIICPGTLFTVIVNKKTATELGKDQKRTRRRRRKQRSFVLLRKGVFELARLLLILPDSDSSGSSHPVVFYDFVEIYGTFL